jgi:hypothetical protein
MIAPQRLYLSHPECLIVLFDLREPGGTAALERQRSALQGNSDTYMLDEDHRALIVYPGWVAEPAA